MGGNKIMEFININNYFFFSFLEMKHNIEEKKNSLVFNYYSVLIISFLSFLTHK